MALQVKIKQDSRNVQNSVQQIIKDHEDKKDNTDEYTTPIEIPLIDVKNKNILLESSDIRDSNKLKKISKEAYLDFYDHYNNNGWIWNYELWCNLPNKEKDWWANYVQDVNERYILKYI